MAEKKTKKADTKVVKKAGKKADKKVTSAKTSSEADEFRTKSADELSEQMAKLKKEQFNLRFQKANGQLERTARIRAVRRDIARIQTILAEQRRKAG